MKTMRKLTILGAFVLVAAIAAVGAFAAVTFDPATGTGFVGKGDVQTAFGWNNAQLQANAGGVAFSFSQTIDEELTCNPGNSQNVNARREGTREGTIGAAVSYDARRRNQINGFILTGFGASFENVILSGTPTDQAFANCVNNNGTVTVVSSNNGPLALYVSHGGSLVQLQY